MESFPMDGESGYSFRAYQGGLMKKRSHWGFLLMIFAAACTMDRSSALTAVVQRDSAGVSIVENPEARTRRLLPWRIDTLPLADIGKVEGEPPYELFRVTGVAGLDSGRVAVVNAGTQEIRFFDEHGVYLKSVGRRGNGPGEYQFPRLIRAPVYDTLRIFDFNGRLSWVAPDGVSVRSWTPRARIAEPVGFLTPSIFATSQNTAMAGPSTPEGIIPNNVVYELVHISSEAHDTVGEFQGQALFLSNLNGNFGFTNVPFDVAPSAAVGDNRLYVTLGEIPEVLAFDSLGDLRAVFRIAVPEVKLEKAQFDEAVEERVSRARDDAEAAELRRRYGKMTPPPTVPRFQRLLVDTGGNLWLEIFRPASDPRHEWMVIDARGTLLGRLETPRGVTLEQITDDFLLGRRRDDSDVEHVVRFGLYR